MEKDQFSFYGGLLSNVHYMYNSYVQITPSTKSEARKGRTRMKETLIQVQHERGRGEVNVFVIVKIAMPNNILTYISIP